MAAILELLLAKHVLPREVLCWLARGYETAPSNEWMLTYAALTNSRLLKPVAFYLFCRIPYWGQEPDLLQDLRSIRDEFVPYFVNLLRDESLHLLQATRSTNSTPAKTPLSLKLNKNNGVPRTDSSNTAGGSRTQLFSPDNNSAAWRQSPGAVFVCESPQLSDSHKGRNNPKPAQQRRSSPYTDVVRSATGSLHKPDPYRSQHRHDLSAYFSAADLEQRLKQHQQSDVKDDGSAQVHSGRRPGNKKRRSFPSGDKRRQQLTTVETPSGDKRRQQLTTVETRAPAFNLVDNASFPSLGEDSGQERSNASLPVGTKLITRSRRVATTVVTPVNKGDVTNNAFLTAPIVTKDSTPTATSCWGGGSSAKFVSSNLEKRLIGRGRVVGQTNQTDNRDRRTDRGSGRLTPEDSGHPLTTGANTKQCDAQPVSSLSGVTPTKDQVIHKVTEWVTADRSLVTHEEDLRLMADVYSRCLAGNFVPNLTVELYFVVQLLTTRSAESPTRTAERDMEEIHHFDSVHNAVYFAVTVLSQQTSLLSVLDRGTLRLLADNRNIANFCPELREHLKAMYLDAPSRPLPLSSAFLSPVGVVSFQADTDNRKNFPTDRSFHLFKKQRDLFYEVIRDWQECHMTPGWNMLETQGEKVRHLVGYRTELANHIHFARLFQSQLIQMCTGDRCPEGAPETEEDEHIALLTELKQTNPDKFKRLQERFVMPSSLGLPCPPPSFPGWQEFFRDFIVAASSHVFNQHLLNSLITKVSQLDSIQFSSEGDGGHYDESQEDDMSFMKCVSSLRLLGKFLGFVAFLPYQTPDLLPDSVKESYVSMRDQSQQPVDVLGYVDTALRSGRVVLTLPWVVEYLSMVDPLAPCLSYFTRLFKRLLVVHRLASDWFQRHQSHNSLLLLLVLGWLIQLPVFPEGLFFKHVPTKADMEFMLLGSLDAAAKIDQSLISVCCPYLGEVRILLVDFAVGINSCSHNIRKITPVLTETQAPSTVTDVQLQQQLEENFFSNHPASLKRTVEFVADRIASNYIKRFRAHTFPATLESGYDWIKELVRKFDGDVLDKRTKEKLLQRLSEYTLKTAEASHHNTRHEAKGYCADKAATILLTLLPEETPSQVLDVATCITERIAAAKISAWMTTHMTSAMLRREFVSTLEKQLKNMKISRNTSIAITPTNRSNLVACPGGRVAMTTTLSRSNEPPGVCVEDRTAHDVTCATPADIVIQFKGVLSRLMIQTDPEIDTDTLCSVLQTIKNVLNNRQDIIPGVYRALAKISVDLAYVLALKHPHMWQENVECHLVALWRTHLWEHSLFHNVICPKHMYLIGQSDDAKTCWRMLTELALCLLRNELVTPEQMEPGILRVLRSSPSQEEVEALADYVCTLATSYHTLHHGSRSEEFLGVLDSLHVLSERSDLEHVHEAVQCCIDVVNKMCGDLAGSSAGGSIHLGPESTAKVDGEIAACECDCGNALQGNDRHSDSITVQTDRNCNKVTVEMDDGCNEVAGGSIHLHGDTTELDHDCKLKSNETHSRSCVNVEQSSCTRAIERTDSREPRPDNDCCCDCGSENVSRLRINEGHNRSVSVIGRTAINTSGHTRPASPDDTNTGTETTHSDENNVIRKLTFQSEANSNISCDTVDASSQAELEVFVRPMCS